MSTVEQPEKKPKKRPAPVEVEAPPIVRQVLSVAEFAAAIGLSESTVLRMMAAGEVRFVDNPRGGKRIRLEEVEAYLRRNTKSLKPAEGEAPAAKGKPSKAPQAQAAASIAADGVSRLRLPR